jgi:alkylation response protein AidB-like acyl-CoA dehydrogenase
VAHRTPEGWTLTGSKPWCSLAGILDRALVTAADDGGNRLFDVDLHHPGVTVTQGMWHATGLTDIPSGPVAFEEVPARPIGSPGWYTERTQFAWGGAGVAACWYGGALALADDLRAGLHERSPETALAHLGGVDEILTAARLALTECAELADAGVPGRIPAKRARGIVARAAEETIRRSAHALGPAPLALDEGHARRVADLDIYVRQHAVDRERVSLGRAALEAEATPW